MESMGRTLLDWAASEHHGAARLVPMTSHALCLKCVTLGVTALKGYPLIHPSGVDPFKRRDLDIISGSDMQVCMIMYHSSCPREVYVGMSSGCRPGAVAKRWHSHSSNHWTCPIPTWNLTGFASTRRGIVLLKVVILFGLHRSVHKGPLAFAQC